MVRRSDFRPFRYLPAILPLSPCYLPPKTPQSNKPAILLLSPCYLPLSSCYLQRPDRRPDFPAIFLLSSRYLPAISPLSPRQHSCYLPAIFCYLPAIFYFLEHASCEVWMIKIIIIIMMKKSSSAKTASRICGGSPMRFWRFL